MHKLEEISIRGFRGIKSLRVDGLHSVNVFLGNNNCGKSSTLEALMIMLGAANPVLPLRMNLDRDYNKVGKDDIKLFFYNLDFSSPVDISGVFDDGAKRELEIRYFESAERNMPISDNHEVGSLHDSGEYGLRYGYRDDGRDMVSTLTVGSQGVNVNASDNSSSSGKAAFVAPRYNFNDSIKNFNEIVTDKEKDQVLEILKYMEPAVRDVTVVGDKVMVDIGLDKLMPINVLGDGTRKLFTMLTAMYSVKGGILIIDEVDNGLYYKTMSVLWSALLKASRTLDVQLFVSTHSLDSLNALNRELSGDDLADMRGNVGLLTLRRAADGTVSANRYDYEKFNYVLGMEVEIR